LTDTLRAHLLVQKLNAIPTPTATAMRMLELAVDPEATAAQYAAVVTTDPGLALQVLRDSNSPERREVSGCELEPALLASSREFLQRLAYTTCTPEGQGDEVESDGASGMTALRRHSFAVAEAAAEIARLTDYASPAEAFTAGLLARIGELAQASLEPDRARQLRVQVVGREERELVDLEGQLFGANRDQMAIAVAEAWDLPVELREVLRFVNGSAEDIAGDCPRPDQELVSCVRAARVVAARAGYPAFEGVRSGGMPPDVEEVLSALDVEAIVSHVRQAWERAAECARPQGTDPEARARMLRTANNELASLLATSEHQRRSADSVTKVLRFGLHRLGEGDPLSGLMYLTMESMNFRRIAFIKPDVEEGRLKVALSSAMRGSQRAPEQSWVPFPAKTRAFGVPAIVSSTDEAPEHQALLGLLGVQTCVIAPLVDQQGKCHGYLAADKGRAGGAPAQGDDRCLGIIADQACLLLEYERLTREMQRLATVDPLTGAATRRKLMDRLESLVALSARTRQPLSLALMDLDHFKRFNDTLGHQVGDRLLIDLVKVITAGTRKSDLVARYGGEEFVVVLPGAPLAGARVAAEELRKTVYEFGREQAESYGNTPISISIGVAELRIADDGSLEEDAMALIGRADQALYKAKHDGRNRVESAA